MAASTTDYFFAQTLAAAGVGVSLVPHVSLSATSVTRELTVVRVEPPRPARHIGLVLPRRRRPQPCTQALAAALTAAAATAADPPAGEGP
ncbi:LysR substrate-binding domain-containing protein [Streptomyces sp. NPDC001549]|uniref:LysR substrate-binding domain-containing protein n=1 Tax=Streptomyces sp. NPDC001549 TaxID=3364586 RepID=UPI0036BBA476